MQDIAGCRVVVQDAVRQDSVLAEMLPIFPGATVTDRRVRPSHGYRAVHVVVVSEGKAIEIQLRTALQHAWAELSEKFADVVDPAIKYGGGDERIQGTLVNASVVVSEIEQMEAVVANLTARATGPMPSEVQNRLATIRDRLQEQRLFLQAQKDKLMSLFRNAVAAVRGEE